MLFCVLKLYCEYPTPSLGYVGLAPLVPRQRYQVYSAPVRVHLMCFDRYEDDLLD